ncbi:MAG: ankyrin repeat domain-containing protein [Bacteroidetes bacterium]|nr:MAG: ankyrin repeat domain-containing protein [Bacteroidota bacterium]
MRKIDRKLFDYICFGVWDDLRSVDKKNKINDRKKCKELINKGANVNVRDEFNRTPLHYAVLKGREDIVKILLKHGANPNVKDNNGSTPLHWAATKGYCEIMKLLLKNKANINERGINGDTPLHYAVDAGNYEAVEFLIKNKADVNIKNDDGNTPFHLATQKEQENAKMIKQIINLLITRGAVLVKDYYARDNTRPFKNEELEEIASQIEEILKEEVNLGAIEYSYFDENTLKIFDGKKIKVNGKEVELIYDKYEGLVNISSEIRIQTDEDGGIVIIDSSIDKNKNGWGIGIINILPTLKKFKKQEKELLSFISGSEYWVIDELDLGKFAIGSVFDFRLKDPFGIAEDCLENREIFTQEECEEIVKGILERICDHEINGFAPIYVNNHCVCGKDYSYKIRKNTLTIKTEYVLDGYLYKEKIVFREPTIEDFENSLRYQKIKLSKNKQIKKLSIEKSRRRRKGVKR